MKNKTITITETPSNYDHLENMSTQELLLGINREDAGVAEAVKKAIPQVQKLIDTMLPRFEKGGRLFYIGAGTSGRLGILDASEIPPTFGMPFDRVIGLIAGGDVAIRKAVEYAEDDTQQAWKDLTAHNIDSYDTLVGIAASGSTPYVLGGVTEAKKHNILTACITNNPNSPLSKAVDIPIEVIVGPEFVTGSTRMKSGTSQKMVLNMISTVLMIKIGRVKGNKMVNMQLTNNKLFERGVRYIMEELSVSPEKAAELLERYGSVKEAITHR